MPKLGGWGALPEQVWAGSKFSNADSTRVLVSWTLAAEGVPEND